MSFITRVGLIGVAIVVALVFLDALSDYLEGIEWPYPKATVLVIAFAAIAAVGAL